MPGILDFIADQFLHNQFFTAAVLAAPAAVVTYSLRALPRAVWSSIKKMSSVEIRFNSDMGEYYKVQEYLTDRVVNKIFSRNFGYFYEDGYSRVENRRKSYVSVGYGTHFGWWGGRPVIVRRFQTESSATEKFKESTEVILLGRGSGVAGKFLEKVDLYVKERVNPGTVRLFSNSYDHWTRVGLLASRPLSTIITDDDAAERVVAHVEKFVSDKDWYEARGLPHHTGILLTGEPGTAKSSLTLALASATRRDIYYLNLAALKEESSLTELMSAAGNWSKGLLVLEDIDVGGATVDRETEGTVSMGLLLNLLDGILTPSGLVVVATTNHVEKLDPALVRPGRFDLSVRMNLLGEKSFRKMAELFEVSDQCVEKCLPTYTPQTGARLRALMLEGEAALLEYFGATD